jgi:hypothetical protein
VVLFQGAVEDPLKLELRGSHFESEVNGMSPPLPSIVLGAMAAVEVIGTEELAKLISEMLRRLGFDSAVRKAGNLIY